MVMKKFFAKIGTWWQAINWRKMFNKKVLIGGGVIIAALIVTIIGVVNWQRPNTYQMALDNIAEARFYLKTAAADNPIGTVHLYSGLRETDYQADGIATPTTPFTVLSVEPQDDKLVYNGCITTEIALNDDAPITVVLEKNPYGNNYAADLGQAVAADAKVVVTFKTGSQTVGVTELANVMPADAIAWDTALEIACQNLKSVVNTEQRMETSTKILCDNSTVNTPYWFVSFVSEDGNRYFVVIDSHGQVVGNSEK